MKCKNRIEYKFRNRVLAIIFEYQGKTYYRASGNYPAIVMDKIEAHAKAAKLQLQCIRGIQ
jgi:hypothetical protein